MTDTKQEALELAKKCRAELWNRPLQQNMSAEIIFEDEDQLQAFYNEARKPLEEELAAAYQAGYNQCLKELSEREPDIIVTEQIAYDYALIENQPLIVRPAYPKE